MRWPEVRAGLIAIAIGLGLVDGCPLPPRGEAPAWSADLVEPIRRMQAIAEWPVAWMRPRLRIAQRWALYQAPGIDRFRMSLDGQTADGTWHVLYRAGDADHDEDASLIEYARVRAAWAPSSELPSAYRRFAAWLTGRALTRHPELVAARMRLEKIRLGRDGFDSTGEYTGEYVHPRGAR
jgi:hypothetical protein